VSDVKTTTLNRTLRSPARPHTQPPPKQDVAVVVDPADYSELLAALQSGDAAAGLALRRKLAWKAYQHTASYDSQVAEWLWAQVGDKDAPPPEMSVPMKLAAGLRYGENPHQVREGGGV
jgi:phosphoribosylaminoimidazolecarboxamide formyltransferase/IMP cyclohydrolase